MDCVRKNRREVFKWLTSKASGRKSTLTCRANRRVQGVVYILPTLEGKSSLQGPTQRKERTDSLRLSSALYTHVIVAHASTCKQRGEGYTEMEWKF